MVCVCFHSKFVVLQTVNKEFYLQIKWHFREAVRMRRCETWMSRTWMLHHDIAPVYLVLLIHEFWQNRTQVCCKRASSPKFGTSGHLSIYENESYTLKEAVSPQNAFQLWKHFWLQKGNSTLKKYY